MAAALDSRYALRTAAPPPRPNVRRRLRDGGDHRLGCDVALAATAPACCRGKPAPDTKPPGQDRRRPRLGIHRRSAAAIRTACRGSRRRDRRPRRNGHGRTSERPENPMARRTTYRRPGTPPVPGTGLLARSCRRLQLMLSPETLAHLTRDFRQEFHREARSSYSGSRPPR